jgi:hypothetical protein
MDAFVLESSAMESSISDRIGDSSAFCLAVAGGTIVAFAASHGGPLTELHERAHAAANWVLTTRPATVTVDTWNAWSYVAEARGMRAKLWETVNLLRGDYVEGGMTCFGRGRLRWLGSLLGEDLTDLAIDVAGQGSTVMVHSAAIAGGVHQRKKRPKVAVFLIAFAIVGHLVECEYALSTLRMSTETLLEEAKMGHDFASIADHLAEMTGTHPQVCAYRVGLGWTISVPLIGLGSSLAFTDDKVHRLPI